MLPTPAEFAGTLILTGPTGSGKSAVALELAQQLNGEIVAMDSMTLYRGMDIGTAKPSRAEQLQIRHHLIDVLDPWESANVAWWLELAAQSVREIRARQRVPILVGGTPFYLKAVLSGLFDGPPSNPEVRAALEARAIAIGQIRLHEELAAVDPISARRLHPNDVRRVVRALEVFHVAGQPISSFQQTWTTSTFSGAGNHPEPSIQRFFVLDWPREELYLRIERRVDAMLEAGWLDEARALKALPQPMAREPAQALGYRELMAFLEGQRSGWEETVAEIKTRTRQFAKRQLTWFRGLRDGMTISATTTNVCGQIHAAWKQACRES
jgi:tRNA dimethylallyltransferase